MAKIVEGISRTFNEFLLLPNLTTEECIPNKNQNTLQTYQWYLQ